MVCVTVSYTTIFLDKDRLTYKKQHNILTTYYLSIYTVINYCSYLYNIIKLTSTIIRTVVFYLSIYVQISQFVNKHKCEVFTELRDSVLECNKKITQSVFIVALYSKNICNPGRKK